MTCIRGILKRLNIWDISSLSADIAAQSWLEYNYTIPGNSLLTNYMFKTIISTQFRFRASHPVFAPISHFFIVTQFYFFVEKNEKNEKCLELLDSARKLIRHFLPPPQPEFLVFFWKKRKVLRILWFGEKVIRKTPWKFYPPPEFLGFFWKKTKSA